MTSPGNGRPWTQEVVQDVAGEYIATLQAGYLADQSTAVALLAQLRRGAGKIPAQMPDLVGITGIERLYEADPQLEKSESQATRAEAALFLTLTLYAMHQQSHRQQRMHRSGIDLGAAVRRLAGADGIDERIRRRFVRLGTATAPDILAVRLREVVTLLKGESIPLDYALLAGRLYQAQTPSGMQEVRQRWGRSFHAYRPPADKTRPGKTEADKTTPDADTPDEDTLP